MNRIIECRLDSTYKEIYTGIWQHDYGQILRITGADLPKAVEVQFSLEDNGGDTLTRIGTTADGVTEVKVPDSLLKNENCTQNYLIYAWIYITDDASGNTEYQIILHVKSRPKPEKPTEEPLPEPNIFHETVEAVNAAADRAEQAEQNAKASATEAGKHAASASESAVAAEKTKEDALKEVGEKKQEAIEAIQEQEETSVRKIINHTDNEIQRIQNQTVESKGELEQTIANASSSKEELDESIQTAGNTKTALDKSTELAGTAKTELDTSIREADEAKTALDVSARTAGEMQETLSATVKQAGALDTSLGEKIETGTQLNEDITASGEKAVQDIQNAGSEQMGKMQAVAEEFTADREQITTNKEDISSLKEEMGKNFLDDAKTKRSLDALWKLNQGISYQFETDAEKAYQKDIPSGAMLSSVNKVGGKTIVWNQLATNIISNWNFESMNSVNLKEEDGCMSATINVGSAHILWERYNPNRFIPMVGHEYYVTIGVLVPKKAYVSYEALGTKLSAETIEANIWTAYSNIISPSIDNNNSRPFNISFSQSNSSVFESGDKFMFKNIMAIDLTQMFGAGNEPSTPEEFEALFSENYYEYNEGELMSMPVNEVVEKGRNLFDCYGFSCSGIYYENIKRDITNNYGTTISTINPTNSITVTQDKVDNSAVISSYLNGYFCVGVRMKNNKEYVMSFDFIPTKMLIDNPIMKLLINGDGSNSSGVIDGFSLNVKKHIVVKFTYKPLESRQYIEFRNGGMSGIFENFQLEDGATATPYSPYHKNTYPIPQAILNLDGYGDGASSDVYNYVDWENKQYHKRVGKYTIDGSENIVKEKSYWVMTVTDFEKPRPSTLNAICTNFKTSKSFFNKWGNIIFRLSSNGFVFTDSESKFANANEVKDYFQQNNETIYYELDEEQIIDISDIIDNTFQEPFEVEAGGTLTFHNSNGDGYRLPVPNEEEYIVSLAEVGGGASE